MKVINLTKPISLMLCILLFAGSLPVFSQTKPDGKGVGVKPVSQLPSNEKRWALIIGIDDYQDDNIADLRGAANDAKTLAESLEKYAGFPSDQIILLGTNEPKERQPTRANILKRLSNLKTLVPKDGLLLVSFSGHGIERGNSAFLIPSDATSTDDVDLLENTALSVETIKRQVKATQVRQVLFLLDACRNDPTSGRSETNNPLTDAYKKGFSFDVANQEVEAFATIYATSVGARAYEYSEKRQGYFSWAIVEGLSGKAANANGEITLGSLVKYVENRVPKLVAIDLGASKVQKPFAVIEGYKADELVLAIGNTIAQPIPQPLPTPNSDTRNGEEADKIQTPQKGMSIKNSIGMEFMGIPAGSFMMGSPENEDYRDNNEKQHRVTLSKAYWLGKYEVTQEEYEKVMGINPSFFKNCQQCPVESVSWEDVQEFIKVLNEKGEGKYRLPTEEEWEYAVRAETATVFSFGNTLSSEQANFDGNYPYGNARKGKYIQRTTRVGNYQSNSWGLYDMHGNVWEWTLDYLGGTDRIIRGGGFGGNGRHLRSATRVSYSQSSRYSFIGFRLIWTR
jgi:formylglycine-generating enzyme required for sulfatase activity